MNEHTPEYYRELVDSASAEALENGIVFNHAIAIHEYRKWQRKLREDPRNPRAACWKDALLESRQLLAKHGIVLKD